MFQNIRNICLNLILSAVMDWIFEYLNVFKYLLKSYPQRGDGLGAGVREEGAEGDRASHLHDWGQPRRRLQPLCRRCHRLRRRHHHYQFFIIVNFQAPHHHHHDINF